MPSAGQVYDAGQYFLQYGTANIILSLILIVIGFIADGVWGFAGIFFLLFSLPNVLVGLVPVGPRLSLISSIALSCNVILGVGSLAFSTFLLAEPDLGCDRFAQGIGTPCENSNTALAIVLIAAAVFFNVPCFAFLFGQARYLRRSGRIRLSDKEKGLVLTPKENLEKAKRRLEQGQYLRAMQISKDVKTGADTTLHEEAQKVYDDAVKQLTENSASLLEKAQRRFDQGQADRAAELCDEVLAGNAAEDIQTKAKDLRTKALAKLEETPKAEPAAAEPAAAETAAATPPPAEAK